MIIWILIALDVISFIVLSLAHFQMAFPITLLILSAAYLIGKFIVFKDLMSSLDLATGVYILIVVAFHIQSFFYWLIALWFAYKLFFTWLY